MTVDRECLVLLSQSLLLGPVPERPISANPGLKFCSVFFILPFCVLPRIAFCAIITVCRTRGSTVLCKFDLLVLKQENLASNWDLSWVNLNHLSRNRALNIYFRLVGFQSYFLLIHLRHSPNTCSHYTKVWHRTCPICNVPLSRSARRSFVPLQKSHRNHPFLCVNRIPIRHDFRSGALDSYPV